MPIAETQPLNPDLKPEPAFKGFLNRFTGLTSIMTDEDRIAQYTFLREFIRDLDPQGYVEIHLARTVALDSWRLNRIKAVEENIFAYGQVLPNKHFTSEIPQVEHAIGHAHTYLRFAASIDKISLYESRLNRSVARNLELLLKLQARRTQGRKQSNLAPVAEAAIHLVSDNAAAATVVPAEALPGAA